MRRGYMYRKKARNGPKSVQPQALPLIPPDVSTSSNVLWALAVLLVPFIGAIGYVVASRT